MDKIYIINPEIIFREEHGEGLLFNPESGKVKILNETGSFIVSQINGKCSKQDIIDRMKEVYDVPQDELESDFDVFVSDLEKTQMIFTLTNS